MRLNDAALTEVTPDAAARWRVLADAASEPNAFADPRFLLPSAAAHPHARAGRVMLVDDGEATVGALSYARRERKVGRLTLRTVSTSESFSAFEGERFHPLTAPGRAEEVFISLIEGARAQRAHLLEIGRLPLNGDLTGALMRAARRMDAPVLPEGEQEFACAAPAPLDGAAEDGELLTLSHLSSSSRKNFRRLARKLERDEGGLEMVEESEDPEAITRFLRLQNAGWKGDAAQDGKSFERTGLDSWFRDVTASFRADGRLSVLSLRTPSRTVFTTVVLHSGSRGFGFHDAYDQELAAYSPGALGRLAELKALLGSGRAEMFDPSMDDQKYPQASHLYPDRMRCGSFTVGVRGPGRHVARHLPMARRLRDRLRRSQG